MKEYTVKNIIFGLRGEYLNFQNKINDLKKYILCKQDFNLYLTRLNDKEKLSAVISFNDDEKQPKSDRQKSSAAYIYDGKTNSFFENSHIKFSDKDKFIEDITNIDKTGFAQNMSMYIPDAIKKENGIAHLMLFDNLMEYRFSDKHLKIKKSVLYNPYEDKVYFETYDLFKKANEKMIRETLDETVPEYVFRRYHKEIMDEYRDKEIIIENDKRDNKCTAYKVIGDGKRLILKR